MRLSKKTSLVCYILLSTYTPSTWARACQDYGFWNVQVTTDYAVGAYSWGDLYAVHSKNPGVVGHSYWFFNPELNTVTFSTNDTSLNNTLVNGFGPTDFEIWQTVPINGVSTPLKGMAVIDMIPSPRGSGRGAEGNAVVVSKLNVNRS